MQPAFCMPRQSSELSLRRTRGHPIAEAGLEYGWDSRATAPNLRRRHGSTTACLYLLSRRCGAGALACAAGHRTAQDSATVLHPYRLGGSALIAAALPVTALIEGLA